MSETELRVAAKAINGFIARVEKLEAENAELKAEVERLQGVIDEIAWITEPYKFQGEMEFASDFQAIKIMAWEHRSENWRRRESDG